MGSYKKRAACEKGFTLFEVLITTAIIGIVAALAIPMYKSYIDTADMAKVNSAYENAIRITRQEFARNETHVALGFAPTLPTGDNHWDRIANWIKLFDPGGTQAPGGGPAYVDTRTSQDNADETGAVRINYSPSSGEMTISRPAYHDLKRVITYVKPDSVKVYTPH